LNRIWVKLSAVIVCLLLVLMAVVFRTFTLRQIRTDRQELRDNMRRIATMFATIRVTKVEDYSLYQDWIQSTMEESEVGENLIYIAIFDSSKKLIAYALNTSDLAVESEFMTAEKEVEIIRSLSQGQVAEESWDDFDHIPVLIKYGRVSRGKVDVGFSLVEFNNRVRSKLLTNIYILVISFFVVVVLSIFVGKRITRPLNRLSDAMLDVSQGKYDIQVQSRSKDEIGRLSQSFNYMTKRLREKAAIEDFSRDLVFSVEYSKLVQMVTNRIVDYMGSEQGAFFLLEERGETTWAVSMWGYPQSLTQRIEVIFDPRDLKECINKNEPFDLSQIENKTTFYNLLNALKQQAVWSRVGLIAPLVSQGETLGFLLLAPELDGTGYDPDEKMFLRTLCHQAGMAIRNSFLLSELTEQERLKRELEIARTVQQSLLPVEDPVLTTLDIVGMCLPATEVGGDYYDYFFISGTKLGIVIADVSGKGASAAFYMAEIKGMMTSLAYNILSPKELLCQLNKFLNQNKDKRVFTTMIYGILDIVDRKFTFVRAGHNALIVKHHSRKDVMDILIPRGMGLGLTNDQVFRESTDEVTIQLVQGDVLFLYTDGISEAMNHTKEEFGEERLYKLVATNHYDNLIDLQQRIISRINEFVQDAKQHDDMTMVIAQCT